MLLVVQLPVVDLRLLSRATVPRIRAPRWPRPLRAYSRYSQNASRRDFVRGVGPVRTRQNGNLSPWLDERFYVDARRGLALRPNHGTLSIAFRRLFSDGRRYRLDVGFRHAGGRLGSSDVLRLAGEALDTSAWLRSMHNGPSVRLKDFGETLAEHLVAATTPSDWFQGSSVPRSPMLQPAHPAVIVETQGRRLLGGQPEVLHQWLSTASVWNLRANGGTPADIRLVRQYLSRLHANLALVEVVCGAIEAELLDPEYEPVLDCVDRLAQELLRHRRNGMPQADTVVRIAMKAGDRYATQVDALSRLADHASRGPSNRRIRALGALLEGKRSVTLGGDLVMGDKNEADIHAPVGSFVQGKGNIVRNRDVHVQQQAMELHLADQARLLDNAVKALLTQLRSTDPEVADRAIDIEDAAAGIRREADKPAPSTDRIVSRLERIAQFASAIGGAGVSVLKIVTDMRGLLGL